MFTRPFGATFGDLLTKPLNKCGLELGTDWGSLAPLVLVIVFIALSHRIDTPKLRSRGWSDLRTLNVDRLRPRSGGVPDLAYCLGRCNAVERSRLTLQFSTDPFQG